MSRLESPNRIKRSIAQLRFKKGFRRVGEPFDGGRHPLVINGEGCHAIQRENANKVPWAQALAYEAADSRVDLVWPFPHSPDHKKKNAAL